MTPMNTGDAEDDEVAEAIDTLAFRMGREPYTFYDADGDPWAVLVRADDYESLLSKAAQLDILQALMSPPAKNLVTSDQV